MASSYYNYQPIPAGTDQIRLLTLLPASDQNDKIAITLRNSPMEEAVGQYNALSYVWGSPDNPESISVATSPTDGTEDEASSPALNTASLDVTQNLAIALRHLRWPHASRTFWIDAICINQQDVAEKGEQVGKMGQIYRSAARVLVWLGPASADSDLAMGLVDHLGLVLRFDRLSETFTPSWIADPQWADRTKQLPYSEAELHALGNLFGRPWFERLWVVQEALANQQTTVICGGYDTTWQSVMIAIYCLGRKATLTNHSPTFAPHLLQLEAVFDTSFNHMLMDLADCTSHLKCADDRDRIYALLSLARDGGTMKPDYSLTTIQVFQELALLAVNQHWRNFLPYCELGSRKLAWPTWVPDWTAERRTRRIEFCNAANFVRQPMVGDSAEGWIRTAAVSVGMVSYVDIVSIPSPDPESIIREIARLLPADIESSTYKTGCSLMEAFSGTLICSSFRPQVPPNPRSLTLQRSMGAVRACLQSRNGADFEETMENGWYLGDFYAMTKNRAFFKTEEGYIGLGPRDIKPGDTILAVLSCGPFIAVRQCPGKQGRYNVVGRPSCMD